LLQKIQDLDMNKNTFANNDSLDRDHEITPFSCKYCDKSFLHIHEVKKHIEIHTSVSEVEEEKTRGLTRKRRLIINPPSSTQSNDIQSVPIQPLKSPKASSSKSGQLPFVCHICQKGYTRKQSLKCHILSHDKSLWLYKCTTEGCHKSFYMRSSLTDHLRTHTGKKSKVCFNEGCGKAYAAHQTRNRHSKLHCKFLKNDTKDTAKKQNAKETFDESDDNEGDWENDLEEELEKGEEEEIDSKEKNLKKA
jgi:uncharacterized Zn-finger protein